MHKRIITVVFLLIVSAFAQQEGLQRLSALYDIDNLGDVIISAQEWHPFPKYAERNAWQKIEKSIQRDLIKRGQKALSEPWPSLEASSYLEFSQTGNRSNYQNKVFKRKSILLDLVMAELIEAKGRFLDRIIDHVWAICEQSTWTFPAHVGSELPDVKEPVVALFSAETGAMLAWIYYLMQDQFESVSSQINQRILFEIDKRILIPCYNRDDFWWMGFDRNRDINNWNPWCNSNWLTCVLIAEQDSVRRVEGIHKIMRSLDRFIDTRPSDGGCDEGPGYWNHSAGTLYIALDQLYTASNEKIDIFNSPIIQNLGEYINKVHINDSYFVNFADAPAKFSVDGTLIYHYGNAVGSNDMIAFSKHAIENGFSYSYVSGYNPYRRLQAMFHSQKIRGTKVIDNLNLDFYLSDIQVMTSRSDTDKKKGLYFAAKGGHNGENHNHNDVGNFIIYKNGIPFIIDVGVETYTRKTFSRERYEIWTMNSDYHNLPSINGIKQKNGANYKATHVSYNRTKDNVTFSLDLAAAYPKEAGVISWKRKLIFKRGQSLELKSAYQLSAWKEPFKLNFMSAQKPVKGKNGELLLVKGRGQYITMQFQADKFEVTTEVIKIKDAKLKQSWGNQIYRIILTGTSQKQSDSFTISFN